jgi:hypothetical protein
MLSYPDRAANIALGPRRSGCPRFLLLPPVRWPDDLQPHLEEGCISEGFKAHKALNPTSGPATLAEARPPGRAFTGSTRNARRAARPTRRGRRWYRVGRRPVRFNAIHTRHHCKPGAT